ncbi:hypothetical protein Zmor_020034 [Zophobas morio]|uniref:Uncharacterized protein n=2 Tax=Zophobas morio TaxID=2755281 RepID=A0AA38I3E4_9CUCU|nr:hypothetical protein Zmor_020034 [Zophobas morio]
MSAKSTRKLNKHLKHKNSPAVFFGDDDEPSSGTTSEKRVRRIRRTADMICFETSTHENFIKSKINKLSGKPSLSSAISECSPPGLKKASIVNNLSTDFPTEKITNDTCGGKRKIIKAKRLLKNNNNNKQNLEEIQEHQNATEEITDTQIALNEEENVQTNEHLIDVDGMMVKTLPSPIAPSESSIEINTSELSLSKHLQFNSSKEEIHPSTSGIVDPPKRRTYELEDSTIDVSLLKSISERDSTRMSSLPSSEDSQYQTPSRVTIRRKWNKPQRLSVSLSDTPSWINNKSSKKSVSFSDNFKKEESQSTVSTSKKHVSKVKIPNFAAIHARALEKIEDITEYKQRKENRAKMLLSGAKPKNLQKSSSTKKSSSVQKLSSKKESWKQLRFAPNTTLKEKSPTFIPLPSTPIPRNTKQTMKSPLFETEFPKFNFVFSKENRFNGSPAFKQAETQTVQIKNHQDGLKKSNFVFSKKNKFTHIPVFKQANVEKKILAVKDCNIKQTFNVQKQTQIKSIVTKSKPVKDALETRRCAIKGVRSNRRFELLMNMRKGK